MRFCFNVSLGLSLFLFIPITCIPYLEIPTRYLGASRIRANSQRTILSPCLDNHVKWKASLTNKTIWLHNLKSNYLKLCCGLFMVTLSLMSIQIIDSFLPSLGSDVVIAFLVLVFPWFFKLIQNNRRVMHLNLICTTYYGLGILYLCYPLWL